MQKLLVLERKIAIQANRFRLCGIGILAISIIPLLFSRGENFFSINFFTVMLLIMAAFGLTLIGVAELIFRQLLAYGETRSARFTWGDEDEDS